MVKALYVEKKPEFAIGQRSLSKGVQREPTDCELDEYQSD